VSLLLSFSNGQLPRFECYECSSDPSGYDSSPPCRTVGSNTIRAQNCAACSTSVTQGATGAYIYRRECSNNPQIPGCQGLAVGTCYCNTSLCNTETFLTIGTLSCYSCTNTFFVDNGCGNVLEPSGRGVSRLSGCTHCVKSVTHTLAGPQYVRSCGHRSESEDYCGKVNPACTYTCTTDLCNSATLLKSLGSPIASAFIGGVALTNLLCRVQYLHYN